MPREALKFRHIRPLSIAGAVFTFAIVALTREHTVVRAYFENQKRLEVWSEAGPVLAPPALVLVVPPPSNDDDADVHSFFPFIKGKSSFCLRWSEDDANNNNNGTTSLLDEWWTHHIEYVLDKANDTHLCLKLQHVVSDQYLYQLRLYLNQFRTTTCDRIHQRYMWSSGWGEFLN
jgi:hypothetical protein